MKTKYRLNKGLAFAEKSEIKKLERLAAQGWLFKRFALGGFLFQFEQGPKQTLGYSMDFRKKPDDEYFDFIRAAGWEHITSHYNQVHVFSAPKGTAPIYSGNAVDEGKYEDVIATMKRGSIYSLVAMLLTSVGIMFSQSYLPVLYVPFKVAFLLSLVAFVFSFLPLCQYQWNKLMNK